MNLFVCYPKCSTCKKAKEYLESKNISFEIRDIVLNNPKKEELKKWLEKSDLDISKLYNTSGLVYKNNNIKGKRKKMNIDEQLELLSSNGMLVKRPLLITEDKVLVGFKKEEYDRL